MRLRDTVGRASHRLGGFLSFEVLRSQEPSAGVAAAAIRLLAVGLPAPCDQIEVEMIAVLFIGLGPDDRLELLAGSAVYAI